VKDYQGIMDAAKTSIKAKQLAAQLIPRFFKFFPELSSQAVETQIDLIEQEELGVSLLFFFVLETMSFEHGALVQGFYIVCLLEGLVSGSVWLRICLQIEIKVDFRLLYGFKC
jgi:hypothetical protein